LNFPFSVLVVPGGKSKPPPSPTILYVYIFCIGNPSSPILGTCYPPFINLYDPSAKRPETPEGIDEYVYNPSTVRIVSRGKDTNLSPILIQYNPASRYDPSKYLTRDAIVLLYYV
jgi:hypothetical protein